jgi:hypothetical protein
MNFGCGNPFPVKKMYDYSLLRAHAELKMLDVWDF